jgi:O-antigen ligase
MRVDALRRWTTGALCLTAFVVPLSIAGAYIAGGLAFLCSLALWIADPASRRWRWTGFEVPWSLYLGWSLAVTAVGFAPARGFRQLAGDVLLLFFVMAAQTRSAAAARRILAALIAGAAVAGVLGVAQWVIGHSWDVYKETRVLPGWAVGWPLPLVRRLSTWHGRAVGFYSHPITFAEAQLGAGFAALGLWLADRRRRWALAALAAFGAMVASGTRGVWLGMVFALVLWAVLHRSRRMFAVLAVALTLFGALGFGVPSLRDRAASLINLRHLGAAPVEASAAVAAPVEVPVGQADQASSIRLGLWREAARLIRRHPWTGVGVGGFRVRGVDLASYGSPPKLVWTETHNAYLQAAVNRGLPGLALLIACLVAMGRIFRRAAATSSWMDGLFFGWVALLAAGMTESWIHDTLVMMHVYLFLGLAASAAGDAEIPVRPSQRGHAGTPQLS